MNKIVFDDGSYIELVKINDKITITIGAIDNDRPLSMIINSLELTIEQFNSLFNELRNE